MTHTHTNAPPYRERLGECRHGIFCFALVQLSLATTHKRFHVDDQHGVQQHPITPPEPSPWWSCGLMPKSCLNQNLLVFCSVLRFSKFLSPRCQLLSQAGLPPSALRLAHTTPSQRWLLPSWPRHGLLQRVEKPLQSGGVLTQRYGATRSVLRVGALQHAPSPSARATAQGLAPPCESHARYYASSRACVRCALVCAVPLGKSVVVCAWSPLASV